MIGEHIGQYPPSRGLVFTAARGGPINHRNFSRRHYRKAVAQADGVPDALRFHDLRHTCAAFLIAEGRHMEEVKDYRGHSSIRVTSDRYGHLFPAAREAIADALDARFRSSAKAAAPQTRPTGTVSACHSTKAARWAAHLPLQRRTTVRTTHRRVRLAGQLADSRSA
jgi:hypothetical protein